MRIITILILTTIVASLLSAAGCGAVLAEKDTLAAQQIAWQVDAENWTEMIRVRSAHWQKQRQTALANARKQMAAKATGPQAAGIFDVYIKADAAITTKAEAELTELTKALNNAYVGAELTTRLASIRSAWSTLANQIPGMAELQAVAEAKARQYVAEVNKLTPATGNR